MSNKKVLIAALICGLITALAVNFYLKSVQEAASNIQTKKVAYANAVIPERTLITADMISFKEVPVNFAHVNSVSEASQVVGHSARSEIDAGEQVLSSKVVPRESTGSSFSYTVPLGLRAISITVTEQSGLLGLVNAGDRVDVIGTADIEEQSKDNNVKNVKHTMTHLVLQNIEVLAVGRSFADPVTVPGQEKKEDNKSSSGGGEATVTLAVPPSKMQVLVALSDKGKITLALRAPADKSEEDRPAVDAAQLLR